MSDGRKKLSGSEYRKRASEKSQKEKEVIAKTRKLETFFHKISDYNRLSSTEEISQSSSNLDDSQEFPLNKSSPENSQTLNIKNHSDDSEVLESSTNKNIFKEENEYEETVSDQRSLENDPAKWLVDDFLRNHIPLNGYKQNEDLEFTRSKRVYDDGNARYLSKTLFKRKLLNGEEMSRPWLVYSESKGAVFCVPCLLFNHNNCAFNEKNGFNDWKHAVTRITEHENSRSHKQSVSNFKQRAESKGRIDNELVLQLDTETAYWRNILKRVISAIKSLASRGLAFRESNEKFGCTNNGNYMMLLEFLTEFDPFLVNHISRFGEKGSSANNYLSKTVYEELIQLMAHKLTSVLVNEIKVAKYFSIIIDSTPDISHVDQLSFIIRYVKPDGTPVERFLKFIENPGHKSQELEKAVTVTLQNYDLNVLDCRGQSYDNAANMSGAYSGLQARLKQVNHFAEYVPYATHSLNLVGVHAAESCTEAASFFATLQSLYNFFTASTHRWKLLQSRTKKKCITFKSLSSTRWSARMDAVETLNENFNEIIEILITIEEDSAEKAMTKQEAKELRCQLERLETAFMQVLWHSLLSRFNSVSLHLQSLNISSAEVIDDYNGLIKYVTDIREAFDLYEKNALDISESQTFQSLVSRKKKRKLRSDETRDNEVELTGREHFRINTFNVILDNLLSELQKRYVAYRKIHEKFSVLTMLKDLSASEVREKAKIFREIYKLDLDDSLDEEFVYFHSYCLQKNLEKLSPLKILKILRTNDLYTVFPNVEIAYRMFICTAITNCASERSFSCLKRVKSYLRSSMSEDRLNNLALLCIESEILSTLSTDDLIADFAAKKGRKKWV